MTERDSAPGTGTAEDASSSDGSTAPEATDTVGPDRVVTDAGQRVGQRPAARPVAVRPVRAPIAGLRQRMESTAALRRSLDAREAEALDLRASIDRLRQELDRERGPAVSATSPLAGGAASTTGALSAPAPRSPTEGTTTTEPMANGAATPHGRATAAATGATATASATAEVIEDTITRPARPSGRSRRTWLWALAAVVLTLLLLSLISRCGSASTPGTGTSATTGAGASPTATVDGASPIASGPGAAAAPATTPMAWPSGAVLVPPGLPTTGPGLSAAGSHLETAVDVDGSSIDAYESLILPGASSEPLVLTLPTVEGNSPPTLRDVQVELDGKPVALVTAPDGSISAAPPSGGSYTKAVVRYRLAGAVSALQPAKANRAAAMVTPLTGGASQAAGTPVVVRTADGQVIAAECPTVELAQRLCAAPQGGAWTATVPASAEPAAVYLLLDTSA